MRIMIRSFCLVLLAVAFVGEVTAQQPWQYSQYHQNPYQLVPAYAGLEGSVFGSGLWRNQWSTFPGNPESQLLNVHLPAYRLHGALGFEVGRDVIGVQESFRFGLSYNWVEESSFGIWSIGLNTSFEQLNVDGSKFRASDGNYSDGQIQHNDPILANTNVDGGNFLFGLSAYLITSKVEGGVAIDNILAPELDLTNSEIAIRQQRQLSVFLTSFFDMSADWQLQIAGSLISDFVQWQSALTVLATYRDSYTLGLGLRGYDEQSIDALIINAGLRINSIWRAFYTYDIGLSDLNTVHQGSHEVGVYYLLDRKIGDRAQRPVLYNTRLY